MLSPELKSDIDKLWNKFWSNGISNPLTAIEQISYLIFMKRLEDQDEHQKESAQLKGNEYKSIFEGHEDCKWSEWTNKPAEEMLPHVRDVVFKFLKELGDKDSLYNKYMEDAVFMIPTSSLLKESVKIINEMELPELTMDEQGDIYEYILSELKTAGKNGQFRTPKHIRRMMAEIVQPEIGEKICDPACGTGGFLISALVHILKKHTSENHIEHDKYGDEHGLRGDKLTNQQWETLQNSTLYGSDIDHTMVRISLMNLIMHGITNPHISRRNSLGECSQDNEKFNVVLANPPFTGYITREQIDKQLTLDTTKTELLYVELMYNLLTTGGRCAVIVPDGVVFGSEKAHKQLRKMLVDDCRLDAVISMPSGVFKPYAGVSTSILYFTKGEPTESVWFYEMESDGYKLNETRDFIDGKGDIPDIIEKFHNRHNQTENDRTGKYFFVPADEIRNNDYDLSISKYREIIYEEVEYESPDVLYNRLQEKENNIQDRLDNLKSVLDECGIDV